MVRNLFPTFANLFNGDLWTSLPRARKLGGRRNGRRKFSGVRGGREKGKLELTHNKIHKVFSAILKVTTLHICKLAGGGSHPAAANRHVAAAAPVKQQFQTSSICLSWH